MTYTSAQILPLRPDPQPDSRCVRAAAAHGKRSPIQSQQIPTLVLRLPAGWAPVFCLCSGRCGVAHRVILAPQTAPPTCDCAVQQPAAAPGPAEEQLRHLHPTGPAGDLPHRIRLCGGVWPDLLGPLHPHYDSPLAQTEAVRSEERTLDTKIAYNIYIF